MHNYVAICCFIKALFNLYCFKCRLLTCIDYNCVFEGQPAAADDQVVAVHAIYRVPTLSVSY